MIPTRLHAALDAASVVALVAGPRGLGWPDRLHAPLAAAGAGVAGYNLLTRYRRGSSAPLSMKQHLTLDALQGAAFCAVAALMTRETPATRAVFAGYGLFSLAAALLTDRPERSQRRMGRQVPMPRAALARNVRGGSAREVAPGVAYRRLGIVNVAFLGPQGASDRNWVLVDAGMPGTAHLIAEAAAERFGPDARPAAIVMTHGHFDHVGALETLADRWDAPVYAHPQEHPYLDGARAYPPGDPSVGGGAMAALAGLYPTAPVDVGARLRALPEDGSVPGTKDWRWLHTPGHAPGHVSFWRARDRTLVAGDAVVTTRQESAYAALTQAPEIHGPPAYFTTEWDKARDSARRLADLAPNLILSGHGAPMAGARMRAGLERLARAFDSLAVPHGARYAERPARPDVSVSGGVHADWFVTAD